MATLKLTLVDAFFAAAGHRIGSPARRGRDAAPAAPCPVEPRGVPLFPPLPDAPDAPGNRREETAVINLTNLDVRCADHAARVERVNRDWWMWEAARSTGGRRTRGAANGVESVRRHLGSALVRVGVRLQGSPIGHSGDPAAA